VSNQVRRFSLAMALFWANISAGPAGLAQSEQEAADDLYRQAVALAKEGKYARACPKFAQSHDIDPAYGAVNLLGVCEDRLGHTAAAHAAFTEALEIARKEKNAARIAEATKELKDLAPRLTNIIVSVRGDSAGITIRADDKPIGKSKWGVATPVNPGARIEATAPGKKPWSTTIPINDVAGRTVMVEVPPLEAQSPVAAESAPRPPVAASESAPPTGAMPPRAEGPRSEGAGSLQRTLGWVGMGVGVVSAGVGAALGGAASSVWAKAKPGCDSAGQCDDTHLPAAVEAYNLAMGSTVMFIVGGTLFAAGLVSRLTAPLQTGPSAAAGASAGLRLTPWIGDRAGGVTFEGRLW
jgi:tetratricopeptide (TPR) repeat protein